MYLSLALSLLGEYGRDTVQTVGPLPSAEGEESNDDERGSGVGGGNGGGADHGGGGGIGARRNRWFELEDDSEDSDSDWDDEDEEDESSPFFGRCALRSLLCRDDDCRGGNSSDNAAAASSGSDIKGSSCGCTCECGEGGGGGAAVGGRGDTPGVADSGCSRCCNCGNESIDGGGSSDGDSPTRSQGSTIDRSVVDMFPLQLTGRSRPPPLRTGEANLHRRRGWGLGSGVGGSSAKEEGARGRGPRGKSVAGQEVLDVQRPGHQALV